MSEVAHGAQPEFWQPPSPILTEEVPVREAAPILADACPRCGSEFLVGAGFCHACGGRRPVTMSADARADAAAVAHGWAQFVARLSSLGSRALAMVAGVGPLARQAWSKISVPSWLHYLHFHEIKRRVGLSTGSLIAFVIGLACVAGALLVGLLTAKTFVDWQAIQFYRAEWLLAATAAFVAGILLKKSSSEDERD